MPESRETRIEKPWSEIEVNGQKQQGLTKELYHSLRKLGPKAQEPRRALEYIIRNWEERDSGAWNSYILQVINQHNALIAGDRGEVNAP